MSRQATGSIVERVGKDGLIYRSLRFSAYGKRRFVALGAVDRAEAERQLRGVLSEVERGIWREPVPPAPEPEGMPTFHEFAEQWWIEREGEWRDSTKADYRWRLERHLLPFLHQRRLDEITIAEVDRYKAAKLQEGALSGESINKTLTLLSSILEAAEERELIARNPARGRRRRVRARKPQRSYLDTAQQIAALLDAAGQLDSEARYRHIRRRAMLATLIFAGLRIGELLDLRWRDVDLATGRLRVGEAKTDAGRRYVTLRPALYDVLSALKAAADANPEALVFGTSAARRQSATNVRKRVLAPAVKLANQRLTAAGFSPLPDRITPHSLRRTFASLLYALGEDPPTVMAEMGHSSPALALAIYAQAMRRDEGEKQRLRALVSGAELALIGTPADAGTIEGLSADAQDKKKPRD